MIEINRSAPLDWEKIGATMLEYGGFRVVSEDPEALALTSIDITRIKIVPILDTNDPHPVDANDRIKDAIARYKKEGYVFLDAKVLEALLEHSLNLPKEWQSLTDTDSMGTAMIEFRGTQIQDKEGRECVLALDFTRGSWRYAYNELFYDEKMQESFKNDDWGGLLRLAAVYK